MTTIPDRLPASWLDGYRRCYKPLNFHGQVAHAVGEYRLARALMVVADDGTRLRAWPDPQRGRDAQLYAQAHDRLERARRRDVLGVA